MTNFTYVPGKRKYLLYTDLSGIQPIGPLVHQLSVEQRAFEWRSEGTPIEEWLSEQKMGSYLYIAGSSSTVDQVQSIAEQMGFSHEEMQVQIVGEATRTIFCCRCHGLHETMDVESTCPHCGLFLEGSDHYSKRWKAYLGYPKLGGNS